MTKYLKYLFFLGIAWCVFFLTEGMFLLCLSDKSLEPSYFWKEQKNHPQTYLVSFASGDEVFFKNQNAQAISAINNGFNHISMFTPNHFDSAFARKNQSILQEKRGAGLWIWKSYFMLQIMKSAPEGSIIIYADSPVIFKNPITPFMQILQDKDILLLLDGTPRKGPIPTLGEKIPQAFFADMDINYEQEKNHPHLWACFGAVKNNDVGRQFVKTWMKNCEHPSIFNIPGADQSMLAFAAIKNKKNIHYMPIDEATKVFKNVHRHPNEAHKSLVPDMISSSIKCFKISEWGYNSPVMQTFRKCFTK